MFVFSEEFDELSSHLAQLFPLLDHYLTGIEKKTIGEELYYFFKKEDWLSQAEADRDVFSDVQEQYMAFAALNKYGKFLQAREALLEYNYAQRTVAHKTY